jgi:aflatoxin B1 aldehyde reductase
MMKKDKSDSIIVGASRVKYLEEHLFDLEKDALPEDVVEVLDKAWLQTKELL